MDPRKGPKLTLIALDSSSLWLPGIFCLVLQLNAEGLKNSLAGSWYSLVLLSWTLDKGEKLEHELERRTGQLMQSFP